MNEDLNPHLQKLKELRQAQTSAFNERQIEHGLVLKAEQDVVRAKEMLDKRAACYSAARDRADKACQELDAYLGLVPTP